MVTPAVERGRRRDFGPLEEILEIIILVLHVNNFAGEPEQASQNDHILRRYQPFGVFSFCLAQKITWVSTELVSLFLNYY